MSRVLLVVLGWCSVIVGVLGIFLPLIPTTPLLLLASWCFAKSSVRFHRWLHHHPRLGPIVRSWQSNIGIDMGIKWRAVGFMWATMTVSMLLVNKPVVTVILAVIGISVSFYIMIIIPTRKREPPP